MILCIHTLHPASQDSLHILKIFPRISDPVSPVQTKLLFFSMKMVDIQKSLVGGFPKIVAPGRKLLMQGFLMKVPRAGGSSGLPRYFILFSDMLMYCKIKSGDAFKKMMLPKPNALECGCLMPLKLAKVDLLVGKGVFKITCQKEELILYSADGGSTSEDWVSAIEVKCS